MKRLDIVVRLLQGRGQQQSETAIAAAFKTADLILKADNPSKAKTEEELQAKIAAYETSAHHVMNERDEALMKVTHLEEQLAKAEKPDVDADLAKQTAELEVAIEQKDREIQDATDRLAELQAENERLQKEVAELAESSGDDSPSE